MIKYLRFEDLTIQDVLEIKDFFEPIVFKCSDTLQLYEDYDIDTNTYKIVIAYDTNNI